MKSFRAAQQEILLTGGLSEGALESSRFQGQQASLRTTGETILKEAAEQTRIARRANVALERAESLDFFGDVAQGITSFGAGVAGG